MQERILQRYSNLEETVSRKGALDEAMALAMCLSMFITDMKDASPGIFMTYPLPLASFSFGEGY